MIRLSLCMIVRDEERMLPGALESVRGLVDEIVVVDTGSVDRTVEIAERAGAKVVHFSWIDDFSAARNVSMDHATGDWILVLDADNRLPLGSHERIRRALAQADALGIDACAVRAHDAPDLDATVEEIVSGARRQGEPAMVVAFVRRAPDIRYANAVHESVIASVDARGGKKAVVDVDIAHYGCVAATRAARGKAERNVKLLHKRIELDHADLTAIGYLALEFLLAGDISAADDIVRDAWPMVLDRAIDGDRIRIGTARTIVQRANGDWLGMIETAEAVESIDGPHPDFHFMRGFAHEALGHGVDAEREYRAAIAMRAACVAQIHVDGSRTWAAATRLAQLLMDLDRTTEALMWFDDAMSFEPVAPNLRAARTACAASLAFAA